MAAWFIDFYWAFLKRFFVLIGRVIDDLLATDAMNVLDLCLTTSSIALLPIFPKW